MKKQEIEKRRKSEKVGSKKLDQKDKNVIK